MSILDRIRGAGKASKAVGPVAQAVLAAEAVVIANRSSSVSRGASLAFESAEHDNVQHASNQLENLVSALRGSLEESGSKVGSFVAGFESGNQASRNGLAFEGRMFTEAQLAAAGIAGVMADSDPATMRAYAARSVDFNPRSVSGTVFAIESAASDRVSGYHPGLRTAMESYNQTETKNAMMYSIVYNLFAAGQDEFGESLYPTIVIPADQVGFGIEATVMTIFKEIRHTAATTADDFKKKLLVRARRNHKLLAKDSTTVVPWYSLQNAASFVAVADFPVANQMLDDVSVPTTLLRFGQDVNLLLLSGNEAVIGAGVQTQVDSLEPSIVLKSTGFKIGGSTFRFNTANLPGSQFNAAPQGNSQERQVFLSTDTLILDENKVTFDGSAMDVALKTLLTGRSAVLALAVAGKFNIESGIGSVAATKLKLVRLIDKTSGNDLPLTSGAGKDLLDLIDAVDLRQSGYEIQAYRSNAQRRLRGQLIDRMTFTQLYDVPLRAPISAQRPSHQVEQTMAEDVQVLLSTTRTRLGNELVTHLFSQLAALAEYDAVALKEGHIPDILGAGRFSLIPYYNRVEIDLAKEVQSLNSTDRRQDISSAIVNRIKNEVYEAYRASEFQAAADQKFGGIGKKPTVIIATDVVTASYITIPGDTRTLGDGFDFRVVTTLDSRFDGKMVIVFQYLDGTQNSVVNELNFGNLFWGTELVLSAQISRPDNSTSHETMVQPRYLFVNHAPVALEFDVVGLDAALDGPYRMAVAAAPAP